KCASRALLNEKDSVLFPYWNSCKSAAAFRVGRARPRKTLHHGTHGVHRNGTRKTPLCAERCSSVCCFRVLRVVRGCFLKYREALRPAKRRTRRTENLPRELDLVLAPDIERNALMELCGLHVEDALRA